MRYMEPSVEQVKSDDTGKFGEWKRSTLSVKTNLS